MRKAVTVTVVKELRLLFKELFFLPPKEGNSVTIHKVIK